MNEPDEQFPTHPIALCLGGVDPSSGAGLFRDVMVLASLGVYPMAVSLAETIQNGLGCFSILPPGASAAGRLDALRPHLHGTWGIKMGLCALKIDQFEQIADLVQELRPSVRIWDPILGPSSGVGLHSGASLRRMAARLLRNEGWVVSPNRVEAAALSGASPAASPDVLAQPWLELGAKAVWLKDGHGIGDQVEDIWITEKDTYRLGAWPRLPGERRGTGCTLASAWLGFRLRQVGDREAAVDASRWLRDRWSRAFCPGDAGRPTFSAVMA